MVRAEVQRYYLLPMTYSILEWLMNRQISSKCRKALSLMRQNTSNRHLSHMQTWCLPWKEGDVVGRQVQCSMTRRLSRGMILNTTLGAAKARCAYADPCATRPTTSVGEGWYMAPMRWPRPTHGQIATQISPSTVMPRVRNARMATLDLVAERDEAHRRIVDTCNLGDGVVNAAQMRSWRGVIRIRSLIVRVSACVFLQLYHQVPMVLCLL